MTASQPVQEFFSIGDVCSLTDLKPHVLRYWETEFPFLSPNKSKSGQRVYSDHEIGIIRRIKELLYEEGFTIAGAKKKLESEIESGGPEATPAPAKKPARKPAAKAKASKADEAAPADPDAAAQEAEIGRLRAGVDKALEEARALLDYLER